MRPGLMFPSDGSVALGSSTVATTARRVLLSRKWFGFVLRWALSHACRHAEYATLVTIRASREYVGSIIDVGSQALLEIAEAIEPTIRSADVVGEVEDGRLGILLADADQEVALRIIQRFAETLGRVRFTAAPMTFAIGAASCPTDGVHGDELVAHATMHPVLEFHAEPAAIVDPCFSF